MTRARSTLVSLDDTPYYHCTTIVSAAACGGPFCGAKTGTAARTTPTASSGSSTVWRFSVRSSPSRSRQVLCVVLGRLFQTRSTSSIHGFVPPASIQSCAYAVVANHYHVVVRIDR
jgi:hypothetical protein